MGRATYIAPVNGRRYYGYTTTPEGPDMRTAPISTRQMKLLLDQLASSQRQAAGYRQLAKAAADLNMEYEVERMTESADEMDRDADDLMDQLIDAGYTPEDV
jgi:hypothetical protein